MYIKETVMEAFSLFTILLIIYYLFVNYVLFIFLLLPTEDNPRRGCPDLQILNLNYVPGMIWFDWTLFSKIYTCTDNEVT